MIKLFGVGILVLVLQSSAAFAAGDSCSSFKQVCLGTGGNQDNCSRAKNECTARCKAGNKLFVAPNGQVHPVTSCN